MISCFEVSNYSQEFLCLFCKHLTMISSYRKTQKLILSNSTPKGQAPFGQAPFIASTYTLWPLKDRTAYQTYINTQRLMFLGSTHRIGVWHIKSEFGLARQISWTLQIASTSTLWPLKDRTAYHVMGDKLKMNFQQGDCQTPLHPAELESTKPGTPIPDSYVRGHNITSTRAETK